MGRAILNETGKQIVQAMQHLADELGHIPSRAEYDASAVATKFPIFRITGLLHSFERVCSYLVDPVIANMTADQATELVVKWALTARELPTHTAWKRSIRNGEQLPTWEQIIEISGLWTAALQDRAHTALANAGYEPTGKAKLRYVKAGNSSSGVREAKAAPMIKAKSREIASDDAAVNELIASEAAARKAASIRQGRFQETGDRVGSELWLGRAS